MLLNEQLQYRLRFFVLLSMGSLLAVVAEKTIAKPKKVNSRIVKQSVRS